MPIIESGYDTAAFKAKADANAASFTCEIINCFTKRREVFVVEAMTSEFFIVHYLKAVRPSLFYPIGMWTISNESWRFRCKYMFLRAFFL